MFKLIRNFFAEQWWRFLIGIQFLTLINFTLLTITASDKIKLILPLRTEVIVLIFLPMAFVSVWLFGLVLEKYVKFPQQQEKEYQKRSPLWNENFERLERIEKMLEARK